jgi:hypothetical protein
MKFTYGSLKKFKVKELCQLCEFYNIPFKRSMVKDDLIDALLANFWDEDYDDGKENYDDDNKDEVQKSVRVRRLEELNK